MTTASARHGSFTAPPSLGTAEVIGDRVRVTGEIDVSNALLLKLAMQKATRRVDDRLTVDLTETHDLDSVALSVLWQFLESRPLDVRVREGSPIRRLLSVSGLDTAADVKVVPAPA